MGCEVPIVPKGMLENLLASEALGRGGGIPIGAAEWMRNAYHTMPPQLFVPFLQPNQPGSSGSMMASQTPLLSNSVPYSASNGTFGSSVGGGLGVLSLHKKEENMSCLDNLETKGKKRNRNRVNGSNRKKRKTDSCTNLVSSNGDVADGKPPASRSRKRVSCAERTEKTSAKRQSCKGIMESENKAEHKGVPLNENFVKDSALQGRPNSGNTGILDIYGLKTMPLDVSKHIIDISVKDLLSENFHPPQPRKLGDESTHGAAHNSLMTEITRILQPVPKPIHTEDKKPKLENPSNLGFRSHLQEYGKGPQHPTQQPETCAMDSSKEPSMMKFPTSSYSASPIAMFPLYPMQDFVSKLGLPPSEPLENLFVKTDRQPDIDENSHVDGNGSIPPLQYSTSLTGGSKSALKRDKELKNGSPWIKAGIVKRVNGTFGLGSGLGSGIKTNANVACELTQREGMNKHTKREATDRAVMIDLNVESSEQLLESSMVDLPNASLLSLSRQETLHNSSCEGRKEEENARGHSENVFYSRADDSLTENENLRRRSIPSKKEGNSEKLSALHLQAHRIQTTNILDVKNGTCITSELKTIQAHEKMKRPTEFDGQKQGVRNLKEVQKPFNVDQNSPLKDEAAQQSPSDLPDLQVGLDKGVPSTGMPNSPRVEDAAKILFDIANSQSQDNGASLDNPQEDPCDTQQQGSPKCSTIPHRSVNTKAISDCDFKTVEENKDVGIKAPANEKLKIRISSYIPSVRKYSPQRTEPTSLNQFQNRTFDSASRKNNKKQGSKDVGKQNTAEAGEAPDFSINGSSSRPSKPVTDDIGLDSVLCTSNQNRRNIQPRSLARGKMHSSTNNNQDTRTNNGTNKPPLSGGQNQKKVVTVGHVKASRPPLSFTDRKR